MKDYHAILGVSVTATQDEIKKAYRKLAREWHPDVSEHADAEARFKEINEAYEVLSGNGSRDPYNIVDIFNETFGYKLQVHATVFGRRGGL